MKDELVAFCYSSLCNPKHGSYSGIQKDVYYHVTECPDCRRTLIWKKAKKRNYVRRKESNTNGKYY